MSDADASGSLDFFDKLVAIVVANQDDCVKMAAGINGHIDANQALIQEMNASKNDHKELPPAVRERIQNKARDELTPAITKKCSTDKGVEAAFNRMGAGRGPARASAGAPSSRRLQLPHRCVSTCHRRGAADRGITRRRRRGPLPSFVPTCRACSGAPSPQRNHPRSPSPSPAASAPAPAPSPSLCHRCPPRLAGDGSETSLHRLETHGPFDLHIR